MDRVSFWYIHDLVEDNPIFQSTGKWPQCPPKYQLAAFFSKVGSDSAVKTAAIISISEGCVVRMGQALGTKLLTFAILAMLGYAASQPPAISVYSLCPHAFPHCRKSFLFSYTKTPSFLIFLLHTSLHCPQPCAFLPCGCWHHPDLRC